MATIITISKSVGANRIVPTVAIPYPVGNPKESAKRERDIRLDLVTRAVEAFGVDVKEPTLF